MKPSGINRMTANELRIGNYIFDALDGLCIVRGLTRRGIWIRGGSGPATEDAFKPIKLNQEWIEKFGFKYHDGFRDSFYNEAIEIYGDPFEKGYQVEAMFGNHWPPELNRKLVIEYVHQLQNLYFALTGTELQ